MVSKIALIQCDPRLGDLENNFEMHRLKIAEAVAEGADLIVFPELSLTGYLLQDMVPDVSMAADDPRLCALAEAAGGAALCVGGIEESRRHAQYIACFYFEGGNLRHVHRKVYLASYGVFDEARYVGRGDHIRAIDSTVGRLGLTICEDTWHPSAINILLLDGAELIVVQTASPVRELREGGLPQNAQTWRDTLRSYARLYGVYIVFVNRVGTEDGLVYWGQSTILGPHGECVVEAPLYDEAVVYGEVDRERVRQARLTNPVLRDERIDFTIRELRRIQNGEDQE